MYYAYMVAVFGYGRCHGPMKFDTHVVQQLLFETQYDRAPTQLSEALKTLSAPMWWRYPSIAFPVFSVPLTSESFQRVYDSRMVYRLAPKQ
jgi:hypothetical protein